MGVESIIVEEFTYDYVSGSVYSMLYGSYYNAMFG